MRAGLASVVTSIVYVPKLCHTFSTRLQRDSHRRHTVVKLDTKQDASKGETLALLGQCECGLITYLFD